MNSRDTFRRTMQAANTGRPVFVPIVYRLAARIEQMPLLDMVSDPTSYANVLEGAYKLLKQDAIITNFDPTLEINSFGCQLKWQEDYDLPVVDWAACDLSMTGIDSNGRIPVLLEATKRLVQTRGRDAAIIGVMTGPCSLATNIAEHAESGKKYSFEELISRAGDKLARFTRSLGEVKVDAIIFREDLLAEKFSDELSAHDKAYTAVYATLFNLTRFFNMAGLVMVRNIDTEHLGSFAQKLNPNGLVLSGQRLNEADLTFLGDLSVSRKLAIGLPLPLTDWNEANERLQIYESFISKFSPRGFFYTSDGEIPPDIPLETIRDVSCRIKGVPEL